MSDERDVNERYADTARALKSTLHMAPLRAAEMERDLSRAFLEQRHAVSPRVMAPPSSRRPWMAAAAAILLIAASAALWRQSRGVAVNDVTHESAPAAAKQVPVASNVARRPPKAPVEAGTVPSGPSRSKAAAARPAVSAHASQARAARRTKASRIIRPAGFMAVPAAAGLPQFESGTIVRVELPASVLPGYGVDISPATGDGPVEADVLVGQDGQPRAIRIVTNNSRSSQ